LTDDAVLSACCSYESRVVEEAITTLVTGNGKPFRKGGIWGLFLFRNDQPNRQRDIAIS
jgi:hypothetical protein